MVIRAGPDGIEIDNDSTRTPRVIHHHHRQFFDYSKNWNDYDYSRNKRVDNSRNNATHHYGAIPSGSDVRTPYSPQTYTSPALPPHAHQCNASTNSRPSVAYPASPNTHEYYPSQMTFTPPKLGTSEVRDNAARNDASYGWQSSDPDDAEDGLFDYFDDASTESEDDGEEEPGANHHDFLRTCPPPEPSPRRPTLDENIIGDIRERTMDVIEKYLNKEMWRWMI